MGCSCAPSLGENPNCFLWPRRPCINLVTFSLSLLRPPATNPIPNYNPEAAAFLPVQASKCFLPQGWCTCFLWAYHLHNWFLPITGSLGQRPLYKGCPAYLPGLSPQWLSVLVYSRALIKIYRRFSHLFTCLPHNNISSTTWQRISVAFRTLLRNLRKTTGLQ